jgi:TonB-linked SusC/RagA family outer membrane protein
MKKTVMLLMSLLFVGIGGMSAQSRTVQGTVVAEDDGLPVIGASVLVVGTSLGGITDFDGQFTILNVPAESKEIQVSYMGMKTQVVAIRPNMTIVLATDAALLEEVVVVAYGQQSRAAITGSVASVGADKIEARPVTNAAGALEGAAAGVQVNNTYGEPGSEATIRIRGFGSVNGTNDPLIVVDGVPFAGAMSDINSADIESMSILKDAASSALYGNKAANGVVLISTKRGKSQGLDVRVNVQQGVYNRGIPEYDRLNPTQWMETVWQGYRRYYMVDKKMTDMAAAGASATATLIDNIVKSNIFNAPKTALFNADGKMRSSDGKPITELPGYTDLDWNKPLERRGYRQEYTASVNTAAEKFDVYASVSYLDEKGYIISSDYNRLSTRMRVNFMPRTWLKAGVNMSAAIQTSNYADNATGVAFINPF